MPLVRKAVIDIGTNSVKLLVAELEAGEVIPLMETSWQTRLGQGSYTDRRLTPEAITQTARAVAESAELARRLQVASICVIATSAARDAANRDAFLQAVHRASGLTVQIISGEQEANWAYRGVTSDPRFADQPLLILDAGGGSSEFILGAHDHYRYRQSFDIGAVRLLERLKPGDPPSLQDLAQCRTWLAGFFADNVTPELERHLRKLPPGGVRLVGTGGTATILARMLHQLADYDRARLDYSRLTQRQVLDIMVQLWSCSLARRRQIPGLPPERADVMLMGVAIYEAVMVRLQFRELTVSLRGLRFGALREP